MSEEAYQHLDGLAKPIGALGLLEDWAARLRDLQYPSQPSVKNPALAVFCADHGVAHAKNVSRYPATLTPLIAIELVQGGAGASVIADSVGIHSSFRRIIDVGIIWPSSIVPDQHSPVNKPSSMVIPGPPVRFGTGDITEEPAMSLKECLAAEAVGARIVADLRNSGSNCIALGEAGIGNTTISAALLSAYTGQPPTKTCGAGSGIDAEGLQRKICVVEKALKTHSEVVDRQSEEPRAVLAALGGLEVAAITGAIMEANRSKVAVIVDGFICSVSALAAVRIEPSCARCMFLATASPETGYQICLQALAEHIWPGAGRPKYGPSMVPLNMGLRLGEGTGALLSIPILRSATEVYNKLIPFEEVLKRNSSEPSDVDNSSE